MTDETLLKSNNSSDMDVDDGKIEEAPPPLPKFESNISLNPNAFLNKIFP